MSPGPGWDRRALRGELQAAYPFLRRLDAGPQAVAAGECDRCADEPRMVQPCGPPPGDLPSRATPDWALGRRCALAAGVSGWCDGHAEEAEEVLAWLDRLPDEADDVARLWWVATGEVRPWPGWEATARRALDAAT